MDKTSCDKRRRVSFRGKRIGVDLDKPSRLDLLRVFFNSQYFFPQVEIEVRETGKGFHFRIYQPNNVKQNLDVRRNLMDDPGRLRFDEIRMAKPQLHHWIDSVPGYSPLIIRDKMGFIDVVPFEDLWESIKQETIFLTSGQEVKEINSLSTMNPQNTGWIGIKRIIRHHYKGSLIRLNCSGGLVDVSPNHSIITWNKRKRQVSSAVSIELGEIVSRPKIRIGLPVYNRSFMGSKDLAWLYGFFVAEGTANIYGAAHRIQIANKDRELMERSKNIFEQELNIKPAYWQHRSDCDHLVFGNRALMLQFTRMFYTIAREKRVPKEILNAPIKIQRSFLDGYLEGDGEFRRGSYYGFTTKSQTLGMGVLFLMLKTGMIKDFRIYTRWDKPNILTARWFKKTYSRTHRKPGEVRKIWTIPYKGYMYDIETESNYSDLSQTRYPNTFCTGVGPVEVHNTLFTVKWRNGKIVSKERSCDVLSEAFITKLPSRKPFLG